MSGPHLLVVIVSFRTRDATVTCVESALREADALARTVRVVVVDNASQDGTVELLRERFGERITLLANPRNAGYGAACNQGAAVDPGAEQQSYIEDCYVCCRPIHMLVTIDDEGAVHVVALEVRVFVGPLGAGPASEVRAAFAVALALVADNPLGGRVDLVFLFVFVDDIQGDRFV